MMIADIVAAVKAAVKKLEKLADSNVYLVAGYEENTGEVEYGIDTIKVTGLRIDADATNVIFEHKCGDIDEMTLSEFANSAYATEEAALLEIKRRKLL